MKRVVVTLAAISAFILSASAAKEQGGFYCTLTGKTVSACCCEAGKNGNLHCTLANKDIKKCCCEGAKAK
jgi:hypothetical protein